MSATLHCLCTSPCCAPTLRDVACLPQFKEKWSHKCHGCAACCPWKSWHESEIPFFVLCHFGKLFRSYLQSSVARPDTSQGERRSPSEACRDRDWRSRLALSKGSARTPETGRWPVVPYSWKHAELHRHSD